MAQLPRVYFITKAPDEEFKEPYHSLIEIL